MRGGDGAGQTAGRLTIARPLLIRNLAAAGAGVVWALCFPRFGVAGLAWAVPALLLGVTGGAVRGTAFRAAYIAAAVHYLISLSWLRFIPFPAGAYTGWLALSFFLALFPPLWALGAWRAARRLGIVTQPGFTFRELGDQFTAAPWVRLNVWFLICAAAWVAWEMFIARLFGGFPWNLLGASQYRMLPIIQLAAYTGVYGVSFAIVWFSTSMFAVAVLLLRDPDRTGVWRRPLIFPSLIMVAVTFGGFLAILTEPPAERRLPVALIQPAIPQRVIFDPDAATNRFEALLHLTESALATRPALVVWPEASLPDGLGREDFDRLSDAVRAAGAWLIFGSDEDEAPSADAENGRSFNSAFLMNPEGRVVDSYRKRRLVMFGEYIPLVRWFPFLRGLAPIGDGFQPGERPGAFRMENLGLTASPLICFEDNFPQQVREHAPPGTDVLVNLTNDAWFDRSAAQWQHLANAVFRAVENGLPLVRATNNGISCWVDARGRVHSVRLAEGRDVYEAGFDVLSLALGKPGRTFYNRVGDLFGWVCVVGAAAVLRPIRRRFSGSGSERSLT